MTFSVVDPYSLFSDEHNKYSFSAAIDALSFNICFTYKLGLAYSRWERKVFRVYRYMIGFGLKESDKWLRLDATPKLIKVTCLSAKVSLFAADLYSFVLESERVWLGVLGEALAIGSGGLADGVAKETGESGKGGEAELEGDIGEA